MKAPADVHAELTVVHLTQPFPVRLAVLCPWSGVPIHRLSSPGFPEQARSRQCAEPGCGKRPVFNHPGEKLPIWCQAHKIEGMVDVLNRLCTHPGERHPAICDLKPSAACTAAQKASVSHNLLYRAAYRGCSKLSFDSNRRVRVRVHMRAGCTKLPSFNFPGQTPASRCGAHREDGMVNVRHRVCQHEGEPDCCMFGSATLMHYLGHVLG